MITAQNWRNYTSFMPDGMVSLFQGKYYWKMPPDARIEVGATVVRPLPKNYLAATERYSGQVAIVTLPSGGLTLKNYRGGEPFPNPAEPHKGWKILTDVWYRYFPHLTVDSYGTACGQNSYGNISCTADELVTHQLSYNTDPGVPETIPGTQDEFFAEWIMTLEPESQKYTASLVLSPTDLTKPQEIYAFIPSLRRPQAVASSARCTPFSGTDLTTDEYRYGFNGNLTDLAVESLGEKKILSLIDINMPATTLPEGYDMPLGWPLPSWGKWQLRDVYEISASKLPGEAGNYCVGKRVMYVDKAFFSTLWEDLYDKQMKPWKFAGFFLGTVDVPGVGPVNSSGVAVEAFWDIQNNHASILPDPGNGRPFYVNEQAPNEYRDIARFTTVNGLSEIMR
ncbi:MAG: DUF1329 domain-containing protein [Candidatus Binataceae bacterium]